MPERRRLKLGSGLGLVGLSASNMVTNSSPKGASAGATPTVGIGPDGEPERRLCGRCRKRPSADPALYPKARREWWLCPSCHKALFGPL
jgi:hypothetical protein